MRKKLSVLCTFCLMIFLSGCNTENEKKGVEKEEPIVLKVFVMNPSRYDGIQEDPVADYIKKKFGIKIELTTNEISEDKEDIENIEKKHRELLEEKLFTNDTDDIIDFGAVLISKENRELLKKAAEDERILEMSSLLQEKAPDIFKDSRLSVSNNFRENVLYQGKGLYSLGSGGGVSKKDFSDNAPWLRWDLYSEMGCPSVLTDDDLLHVLETMQNENPETLKGEKVYALGIAWSEESFKGKEILSDYPLSKGYEPLEGNCAAYLNHGDMSVCCPVVDEESFFWKGVEFYYKAEKMGILDEDAPFMNIEDYVKKVNRGNYLAGFDGKLLRGKESILAGQGMRTAGYMPLSPFSDAKAVFIYEENILGSRELAIGSNCKNQDKAMEFLNWCFTEEGSRILHQGTEGTTWKKEKNQYSLTEEYKKDASLGITELEEKYGKEKFGALAGFSSLSLDSNGNYIQIERNLCENQKSELYEEAEKHYNINGVPDVFWTFCTKNLPEKPEELEEKINEVQEYVADSLMNCVYADDEKEFKQIKKEIISNVKNMGIEDIADWYKIQIDNMCRSIMKDVVKITKNYIRR